MRSFYRHLGARLLLYCLLGLLSGCVVQKDRAPRGDTRLAETATWVAQGKMSYDLNGQRGNFSFNWVQAGDAFDILLYGPLGISVAKISGNQFAARIETAEGQVLTASSPNVLVRETLGLEMPVSAMFYWIRGVPGQQQPAVDGQVNMTEMQTTGFTQLGWEISVLRRDERLNPSRIRITRPGAKLLVVVKDWEY